MWELGIPTLRLVATRAWECRPGWKLPFAVAGVLGGPNLYIRHCAALLDTCLRASKSSICRRLSFGLSGEFAAGSWDSAPNSALPIGTPTERRGRSGVFEFEVKEEWICSAMPCSPYIIPKYDVCSTAYTNADEINYNAR